MSTHRLPPPERKQLILDAAIAAALEHGFGRFTREHVGLKAEVGPSLVNKYFSTMTQLRRAVMGAAIHNEVLQLIREGIVLRDSRALQVSEELKQRAMGDA